jgi:hypothetical protein
MERFVRYFAASALTASLVFGAAGCHKQSDEQAAQNQTQDQTTDPAAANMAPVDENQPDATQPAQTNEAVSSAARVRRSAPSSPTAQPSYSTNTADNTAPPPPDESTASYPDNGIYSDNTVPVGDIPADQSSYYDDSVYQQPVYATQPPPEIPVYVQPPCPGPNYIWTPGHWAWSPMGYYWVPGAWVMAPYTGALWTPGFWLFVSIGHFFWHPGFWGPHIGYYGGINYGNGYFGHGYDGGYWNRGNFYYNRSVTNVNTTVIKNVYVHNVTINNYNITRVSYHGGPGGVQARPLPAELAAMREPHLPPLRVQTQHIQQAAQNRAQFYSVNRGRPQVVAVNRPLATPFHAPAAQPPVHGVANPGLAARQQQRVIATPQFNRAEQQGRTEQIHRSENSQPAPVNQLHPQQQNRVVAAPQYNRAEQHAAQQQIHRHETSQPAPSSQMHPQPQPQQNRPNLIRPQARPETQPRNGPAPQTRPQERPAPTQPHPQETRPAPAPQSRPQPEYHPAPASQPRQERPRPQPQAQRQESPRPQAQARPEAPRPQSQQHQEAPRPQQEHPHAEMQRPSSHAESGHGRR